MNARLVCYSSSIMVSEITPWMPHYLVRLHWGGKRGLYAVPMLKPWQRWRERRGVGRYVHQRHR